MKRLHFAILLSMFSTIALAQNISGLVIVAESEEHIPFASLKVELQDSVRYCIADENGRFNIESPTFPIKIEAKSMGMKTIAIEFANNPDTCIIIPLEVDATILREVTVTTTAKLIKLKDDGLVYDMSKNLRAQNENTFQALAYVPLLNVNFDGELTVHGSSNYVIYLNGKPYDMAQVSPKSFLESLPASTIKEVEVITAPTSKYASAAGRYIINIVLKGKLVDGYNLNFAIEGSSQPRANGSVLGIMKRRNVDFSLNYDYNLNGQRSQPAEINYNYFNDAGDVIEQSKSTGNGNGDWQYHTMRAMFNWTIDSLNSVYADFHSRINTTDITGFWTTERSTFEISHFDNDSYYKSGALESNVIYRNYFPKASSLERFMLGYHYTYNPDKRHYIQKYYMNDEKGSIVDQQTDGGMMENAIKAAYLFVLSDKQYLSFTLNDVLRNGNTGSRLNGETINTMNYCNNVASAIVAYTAYLSRFVIQGKINAEYDYLKMELDQSQSEDFHRYELYLTPSIMAYWQPNTKSTFQINYYGSIKRPMIEMLNPFQCTINGYTSSVGNPLLKPMYSNDVLLSWYFNPTNSFTAFCAVDYTHSDDVIMSYYREDENQKIESTYGNLGRSEQSMLLVNARYTPFKWLSVTLDGNIGIRHLKAEGLKLSQRDWFYNITPRIELYLPENIRIGGQFGLYKVLPQPWSTINELFQYSFYASKSLLKGRLNISVSANSPFNKYNIGKQSTFLSNIHTIQSNKITARSFGVNLSYTFGSGQKIDIQRDNALKSTDLSSGVK